MKLIERVKMKKEFSGLISRIESKHVENSGGRETQNEHKFHGRHINDVSRDGLSFQNLITFFLFFFNLFLEKNNIKYS